MPLHEGAEKINAVCCGQLGSQFEAQARVFGGICDQCCLGEGRRRANCVHTRSFLLCDCEQLSRAFEDEIDPLGRAFDGAERIQDVVRSNYLLRR